MKGFCNKSCGRCAAATVDTCASFRLCCLFVCYVSVLCITGRHLRLLQMGIRLLTAYVMCMQPASTSRCQATLRAHSSVILESAAPTSWLAFVTPPAVAAPHRPRTQLA